MKKSVLFVSLVFILSSTVVRSQEKGEVYEGSVKIKNSRNDSVIYEIPLAPGKWIVDSVLNRSSTGGASASLKDVQMINVIDGVLSQALEITAKVDATNIRWNDEPCKVEPYLYKNDYGTKLWKQKCLLIRPITFLQNNNEITRSVLKSLSDRGIKHDFNSLNAIYTRYGDYDKFLVIKSHFFPSNYGLPNPVVGIMNSSPYHPSLIGSDLKNKAMVDALSSYMESVVNAYDASYSGDRLTPIIKFVWPSQAESVDKSKDEKIQILEKSYSLGILSKDEYERKKSELLRN